MTTKTSRRRFLGVAAGLVGAAVAAPVLCSGTAFAGPSELPIVNHPDHPDAEYAPNAAGRKFVEPLNASVNCGLTGRNA